MPREKTPQLPAVYQPPAAIDSIDMAAELLGIARARPQHRDVMVQAVRALLDGDVGAAAAIADSSRAGAKARRQVVRKPRKPRQEGSPQRKPFTAGGVAPGAPGRDRALYSDLTVVTEPDEERIEYGGKIMELTDRQAALASLLVRAMPNPIGREFLVSKLFTKSASKSSADQQLSVLTTALRSAAAAVGVEIFTVRGVGVGLKPAAA